MRWPAGSNKDELGAGGEQTSPLRRPDLFASACKLNTRIRPDLARAKPLSVECFYLVALCNKCQRTVRVVRGERAKLDLLLLWIRSNLCALLSVPVGLWFPVLP